MKQFADFITIFGVVRFTEISMLDSLIHIIK